MLKFKKLLFFVFGLVFMLESTQIVFAGFGVTPGSFRNDNLARDSYYEQQIRIIRGEAEEALKAQATINFLDTPYVADWISIDKGTEFILLKGEKQTPIMVSVKVPQDARVGKYKGNIRIITSPLEESSDSMVSLRLGVQVEVLLEVTENGALDFSILMVDFGEIESGHKGFIRHIPTKAKLKIKIKNAGNIEAAPTKVQIDFYNKNEEDVLESKTINSNQFTKLPPFEEGWIEAWFTTKLEPGNYRAEYKIFKENDIVNYGEGEINFAIDAYQLATRDSKSLLAKLEEEFPEIFNIKALVAIALTILVTISFGIFKFYFIQKNKR